MNKQLWLLLGVLIVGLISVGVIWFLVIRGVGQQQSAVPSRAAETDPNKCQGNAAASAKCFKCETGNNKNNPIGILDFSCFAKYYGQTVGKP